MPAQYIYQAAAGSNVDISGQVRAYTQQISMNAEEGSVAVSSITVDDQLGGLNIIGHHKFFIHETSEASNSKTIMYGLVADRDVSRGPFRIANSREWTVNLADVNSLLGRRIMRGSDANRPAETDLQRIQWLLTTGEMRTHVLDSTYVNTSATTYPMDAVDYRDQTILSIIDDCAQQSGKNYFLVLMNEDLERPLLSLWYDFATSSAFASSVRLTNVLADVDSSTTFAVFNDDLKLNRDPSRVYSAILLPYDGGEIFDEHESIVIEFGHRDTTAPSINVKTAAKATARAERYLADIATEEDRLTMSYLVPLATVNHLREGQRFLGKFSHLPGYEDWRPLRTLKRTVFAISEDFYKVTLEATPIGGTAASCSTALAAIVAGTYTTNSGGASPASHTVNVTPTSYPCVVFVSSAFEDNNASSMTTGGGYTTLGGDKGGGGHFLGSGDYKALTSGLPGNVTYSWGGGATFPGQTTSAIALQTSASTPVQSAQAQGGNVGVAVTLANAPTVGNILIALRQSVGTSGVGMGNSHTPTWTQYASTTAKDPGSLSYCNSDILVRCVQSGDGASWELGENMQEIVIELSEWAIS